jgi:hypothetical protein
MASGPHLAVSDNTVDSGGCGVLQSPAAQNRPRKDPAAFTIRGVLLGQCGTHRIVGPSGPRPVRLATPVRRFDDNDPYGHSQKWSADRVMRRAQTPSTLPTRPAVDSALRMSR